MVSIAGELPLTVCNVRINLHLPLIGTVVEPFHGGHYPGHIEGIIPKLGARRGRWGISSGESARWKRKHYVGVRSLSASGCTFALVIRNMQHIRPLMPSVLV